MPPTPVDRSGFPNWQAGDVEVAFLSSLSQLPQLSEAIVCSGALRLESPLLQMHAVSLLHADVKSSNVVLNTADIWRLCGVWPASP